MTKLSWKCSGNYLRLHFISNLTKVNVLWEGNENLEKQFPIFLTWGRLFQILWLSHNILTLPLIIHWNCFWIISLFTNTILWNLDFDMASNGRCVFVGGKLPPSSLGRVCLCNWLWGNPVFGRFNMVCVSTVHSICSTFGLLTDESRDLSQAEKKITVSRAE